METYCEIMALAKGHAGWILILAGVIFGGLLALGTGSPLAGALLFLAFLAASLVALIKC